MDSIFLLSIDFYLPVILKIILLVFLLYIPLPIVIWIYRRRKGNPSFKAEGTFHGFKITAGESAALYFILFIACLSSSIPIVKSIDSTQISSDSIREINESFMRLKNAKDSILSHQPWTLRYTIRLKTDSNHALSDDDKAYENFLDNTHFHTFPPPISMDPGRHSISYYLGDDIIKDSINYRVTIDNFHASYEVQIKPESKRENRIIDLGEIPLYKVSESAAKYSKSDIIKGDAGLSRLPNPN
ncbi:MAG: hypothetical protein C5B59_16585 [Bacteroidetes bacterium]|nr:MAG: hypothetical protein C5B59_16585 [Bacteroidota bacterium]